MRRKFEKSAANILREDCPQLQGIDLKFKQFQELTGQIKEILDPALWKHCHIKSFSGGKLVIAVSNSSVATHLRYLCPMILQELRGKKYDCNIREVLAQVDPALTSAGVDKNSGQKKSLSAAAGILLSDFAETVEDPRLKEALERLSKRT